MLPDSPTQELIIAELVETIEQLRPESLVYCTGEQVPALEALSEHDCRVDRVEHINELEQLPRFELGVIFDHLEQLSPEEGVQLLCRMRNLKCEKLWVAVTTCSQWDFNTMIGLGFNRRHCYREDEREVCTYSYDLASYNRKREWNNPRFWANPENWGKYRW